MYIDIYVFILDFFAELANFALFFCIHTYMYINMYVHKQVYMYINIPIHICI